MGLIVFFGEKGISQSTLSGKVIEEKTDSTLVGVTIHVFQGENLIRKTKTNSNGNFYIKLMPGYYELEFSYQGYSTQRLINVSIVEGQATHFDYYLNQYYSCEFMVCSKNGINIRFEKMEKGLIYVDKTFLGKPNRNISDMIGMTAGVAITQ